MTLPTKTASLEEQLAKLPATVVGEIVSGELYVNPRPAPKHARAASSIGGKIVGPFDHGQGGRAVGPAQKFWRSGSRAGRAV